VAFVAAGACTSGDDGTSSSTSEGDPAAGEPVPGGVLRMGVERLPSLDPLEASAGSPSASIVADLLYDGLTASGARVAVPALATHWETGDGAVTWRFTLRADARFSDGRPVTAVDVEASLDRAVARGLAPLRDVAEVRTVDPVTVEVVMERPTAALPEILAAPGFGIAGAGAGGAVDPATGGTGPFRFTGFAGDVARLVRAEGSTAYLDGIDVHLFDDLGAAFDAFEAGGLDWTLVPPARAESAAEAYGAEGFVPFQTELFFGFNLASPVFADVRFRRAIVTAVDRSAVVRAVYFGVAEALDTIVPAGVAGHDPARCGEGCAHDPDVARVLLAQAFPPESGTPVPEVVIDHEDTPTEGALAQALELQLEAVGIPATPRPHAPADFPSFAVSGDQALVRLGWVGTAPTAELYLEPLFRTGAPDNLTGYSDTVVDVLLEGAARALDNEERLRLLGEAEAQILAAAPVLPIAQFRVLSVASDAVHDLTLGVGGTFDGTAVWLQP
jgi:ABC-type transport system substrate-binding protein